MAYRRLVWMSKGLIPALAYSTLTTIQRNRNDDSACSAPTGSRFFLAYSSTLFKDEFYSLNLLSVVNNVSELPQGNKEFLEKVEAEVPTERIKNVDGDNVYEAGKDDNDKLIDMAIDIRRQLGEIEEKEKEVDKLLGEMIAELKGFASFLTWNTEDEKVIREEKTTRIVNIITDLTVRHSKCVIDFRRLNAQIEGKKFSRGEVQKPLKDAVLGILIDMLRLSLIKRRVFKKAKKLRRMLRRREQMQFCLSIVVGGR